jgi:ABC-2 type transport system ATP-binding protein
MSAGQIVAEGPPSTLIGRASGATVVTFRLPEDRSAERPNLGETKVADGSLEIRTEDPTRLLHDLTGWALERGVRFEVLEVRRPSLEDVYLELTNAEAGTS